MPAGHLVQLNERRSGVPFLSEGLVRMIALYAKYLLVLFCMVLLYASVGHVAVSLLKRHVLTDTERVFFKLLSGSLFITAGYAVVMAGGASIFTGFLIVVVAATIVYRGSLVGKEEFWRNVRRFEWSPCGVFILYMLVVSLLVEWAHVASVFGSRMSSWDIKYWAALVSTLNSAGIESSVSEDPTFMIDKAPQIYHYFELWMAAFSTKLFDLSAYYAILLHSTVFLLTLLVFGGYALALNAIKKPAVAFLAAFGIVAVISWQYNPFGVQWLPPGPCFLTMYASDVKLPEIGVMFVWFLMTWNRTSDIGVRLLPLFVVMFVNSITAPVLSVSVTCVLLCMLILKRCSRFDWELRRPVLLAVIAIGSIGALYGIAAVYSGLHRPEVMVPERFQPVGMLHLRFQNGIFCVIRESLIRCIKSALMYVVPTVPFIGMAWMLKDRFQKISSELRVFMGLVVVTIYLVSASAGSVFYAFLDFSQVPNNVMYPLLAVICFAVFCNWLAQIKMRRAMWSALIIFLIWPWVSSRENRVLITEFMLRERDDQKQASMLSDENKLEELFGNRYHKIAFVLNLGMKRVCPMEFWFNYYLRTPFSNVRNFSNYYYPICLSFYDIQEVVESSGMTTEFKSSFANRLEDSPFANYVFSKKRAVLNAPEVLKLQLDFLKEHKIPYVIVPDQDAVYERELREIVKRVVKMDSEPYKVLELGW